MPCSRDSHRPPDFQRHLRTAKQGQPSTVPILLSRPAGTSKVSTDGVPKHRPSEMVKGEIYGFLEGYGHEDIMLRKS